MAAALNVSPAAIKTFLPSFLYLAANLPIVVVLPTPFTPTITIIDGEWLTSNVELSLVNISSIINFNSPFTSLGSVIFLVFIASVNLSIISIVVSTPTSAVINISSISSINSSSTFVYDFKTWSTLSVIPCFAFDKPCFNLSNKLTFASLGSSTISSVNCSSLTSSFDSSSIVSSSTSLSTASFSSVSKDASSAVSSFALSTSSVAISSSPSFVSSWLIATSGISSFTSSFLFLLKNFLNTLFPPKYISNYF